MASLNPAPRPVEFVDAEETASGPFAPEPLVLVGDLPVPANVQAVLDDLESRVADLEAAAGGA